MITIDPQVLALAPGAADLSRPALSRFLNRARTAVGLTGEVEVFLTSDGELKRLNRAFRNKNKATDILSFPTPPEIAAHHAGDLALSLETAAHQAAQFGHALSDELRILILHGLLHLSGLDHETDAGAMAEREAELRATLKLPANLIARVTTQAAPMLPNKKAAKKSPQTSTSRRCDPEQREKEESPHSPRVTKTARPLEKRSATKSAAKSTKKAARP